MSDDKVDQFELLMKAMIEQNTATLKAIVASNDASNQIVLYKLDNMEVNQNTMITAVNKTNGSVAAVIKEQAELKKEQELLRQEQDHKLSTHTISCSSVRAVEERVVKLENENVTMGKLKKMVVQLVASSAGIAAIVAVVYKIFFE